MSEKQLSDGGPDGTVLGQSASDLVGFYGETPVAQRTGAGMTSLTVTYTASNAFGFTTSAEMERVLTTLEEIQATLTGMGLHGG